MRGARPAAVTTPLVALGAVTAAMHVISRTTGSGWLVVVVSFLLSLLGLSALLPALALARCAVGVRGPADAIAGRPVTFTVTADGWADQLRLLRPEGDWVRLDGPSFGPVTAVPARRGVIDRVDVEVRSAAPFGLLAWRRLVRVPLERPLEVGPMPLDVAAPRPDAGDDENAGEVAKVAVLSPEMPRGVRDYVAGDPPRLVSWVATARHGRLMVKEMEGGAVASRVTLVVDLRGDGDAAEAAASRAAGMAIAALRRGSEVSLATAEAQGPRLGPVTAAVEVGRRLARATADGPPAEPVQAAGAEVVRVTAR